MRVVERETRPLQQEIQRLHIGDLDAIERDQLVCVLTLVDAHQRVVGIANASALRVRGGLEACLGGKRQRREVQTELTKRGRNSDDRRVTLDFLSPAVQRNHAEARIAEIPFEAEVVVVGEVRREIGVAARQHVTVHAQ